MKSAYHYCPHQDAAKPSDLLKILGQELREHYELPHDLPFEGLRSRRNDRGGIRLAATVTIIAQHCAVAQKQSMNDLLVLIASIGCTIINWQRHDCFRCGEPNDRGEFSRCKSTNTTRVVFLICKAQPYLRHVR